MQGFGTNRPLSLQGVRVLDMTRMLPGPLCTMILGDYGADIIKVEDLAAGDPTRFAGSSHGESGSLFRQLNRNKKSLALDLKNEKGQQIIKRLAARADILVEGFRPGVMDRLGLGYQELSRINGQLIYAAVTGYGQESSYREKAGHDINYCALSGLLDLSAEENGSPVMPAVQVADIAGGSLLALSGIMIALFEREKSGEGRFVDISMARGLLPFLSYPASCLSADQKLPRRGKGQITGAYACYNIYETADCKYMSLGALEPVFWQRFCAAVARKRWIPRQFEEAGRKELIAEVRALFKSKTRLEWEEFFADLDVCCEPVLDLKEAVDHPLSREENYWLHRSTGKGKTEKLAGFPLLFSGQGGEMRLPPPQHGEHTAEILCELGYDHAAMEELKDDGVI